MRTIVAGLAITLDGVTESPSSWLHFNDEMGDVIAAGIAQSDAITRCRFQDAASAPPRRPAASWTEFSRRTGRDDAN
jgi:hypothetical protein